MFATPRCVLRAPSLTADPRPSRMNQKKLWVIESQIELWTPAGAPFGFASFGTDRLRCQLAMKTAGRGTPNRWAIVSSTEHMVRSVKTHPTYSRGCEARKIPAAREVFFLDFDFYRTTRPLAGECRIRRARSLGHVGGPKHIGSCVITNLASVTRSRCGPQLFGSC